MKIEIDNKKIDIDILTNFIDKFKSFKFKLDEIENGICFIKKKIISTYLFCQKVDIIFTDNEFNILKIIKNSKSEKIYLSPKNSYYTFILKENSTNNLEINTKLKTYKN